MFYKKGFNKTELSKEFGALERLYIVERRFLKKEESYKELELFFY